MYCTHTITVHKYRESKIPRIVRNDRRLFVNQRKLDIFIAECDGNCTSSIDIKCSLNVQKNGAITLANMLIFASFSTFVFYEIV